MNSRENFKISTGFSFFLSFHFVSVTWVEQELFQLLMNFQATWFVLIRVVGKILTSWDSIQQKLVNLKDLIPETKGQTGDLSVLSKQQFKANSRENF